MRVFDHLLQSEPGETISFQPSPNQSPLITPRFSLMHYTAGRTLEGAISWFCDPDSRASAHLVIGRDGEIVQLVPFDKMAWHAGQSSWGRLDGMNRYSIGIELVNAGKLHRRANRTWEDKTESTVPNDEVMLAVHQHERTEAGWQRYTAAQLEAAVHVGWLLQETYGFSAVLGHEDVCAGRKTNPGPAFPMERYRASVLGKGERVPTPTQPAAPH